ncbi:MAG: hypothetical protein ACODAA_01185 [Gemmatimonadota bacterium]
MEVRRTGRHVLRVAGSALAFVLLGSAAAVAAQEDIPVAPEAAHIADAERAFDRLEAEAGLRAGGSFSFDYQHLAYFTPAAIDDPVAPVHLWTAASVQADRVKGVFEGGWKYSLDMTVELHRADTLVATADARTALTLASPLTPATAAGMGFPIQALLQVPPGEYDYRIRIRDNGWEGERATNETSGRLVVPEPVTAKPFVSSVAIAADSGGTWRPAEDLELQLNAARMVHSDARPFVYFEAYGLTPDGDYRGEVRLVSRRVTRGADDVFDGAYQPFQLQYRGSVPSDPGEPVRKVLRLDLGETRPGPYEVQVRVRDLVTGRASEVRSARLRVRERISYQPLLPVAVSGATDVEESRAEEDAP